MNTHIARAVEKERGDYMRHRWTEAEIELLQGTMSNEKIARLLGVSKTQVSHARRYYTGHYVPYEPTPVARPSVAGECGILDLAKKIGVKLGG